MVDKILWLLGILLVLGVGGGAWWSMEHPTPPAVARMLPSGTVCPEDKHVVWSRRDGRQCLTTAELQAAAQEEEERPQLRHMMTLGPGVICRLGVRAYVKDVKTCAWSRRLCSCMPCAEHGRNTGHSGSACG